MSNQAGKMTGVQKYTQMFRIFFFKSDKVHIFNWLAAFKSIFHTITLLFWLSENSKIFLVCKAAHGDEV